MAKKKESKTNAMRILDKNKISYEMMTYECNEFIDAVHIADMLQLPYETMYKTLITQGTSNEYYVFVLPIHKELDLKKAAKIAGEKALTMVHVKEIFEISGYIRGGCTAIGMKKYYKTYIDQNASNLEKVIVSGGKLGVQIKLKPDDLCKVVGAVYEDII